MKLLGSIFTVALIAALWLFFAPLELGGRTGYVMINGNSMNPELRSGDLVIVRSSSAYEVGDVVTYQHPELGPVIHRIIAIDGARFVLQGDNNAWVDAHEPTQTEITGKLWFAIPGAGHYIGLVRQPGMFTLLSIVMGLIVMLPHRKTKPTRPRAAKGGLPTLMEPIGRDLLGLFAVFTVGAMILAGLAFTRSLERQAVREMTYEHHGSFSYSAAAPEGIYDAPEVASGEPIFRALTDSFDVQFDYALSSKAAIDSSGIASLRAEVHSDNGWQRSFELQPPREFTGPATTVSGRIDLTEIQQIISRVETETGITNRQYILTIQPDIAVDATVGGEPVQEQFAPAIDFQMDAQQLQLIRATIPEGSVLDQAGGGLVTQTRMEPNSLSLVLFELDVTVARQISLVVLGVIFAAVIVLLAQTYRVRSRADGERLAAMYGPRLVAVRSGTTIDSEATVEVAGFKDFKRLLDHHQGPIFRNDRSFYIDHDGQRYRFGPAQCPPPSKDTGSAEPVPEQPVEAVARRAAAQAKPRRQFAISNILFKHRSRMERA